MKRILLTLILLCASVSYGQSFGDIPDAKLWLRANPLHDSINKIAFNFNPVIRFDENIKKEFRNVYKKDISLFIVFKSKSKDETPVLTLKSGNTQTFLTNKSLYGSNEYLYKKVISDNGILVTYLSSGSIVSRKSKIDIETLLFDGTSDENNIMELICFDRILNNVERAKVETYLSIKYGTSIIGDNHYIDSSKDTLWNSKKNKIFNNHVTGIGRDDIYGLYQKQSGNSQKDGLYIGVGTIDSSNFKNKAALPDKCFLLWGHNGKKTMLLADKENKNHKLMKRVWKLQSSGDTPKDPAHLKFRLNKNEADLKIRDKGKSLWLAVSQNTGNDFVYTDATYYKQTIEDSINLEFDSIPVNAAAELFTFIEAPDFFFEYQPIIDGCDVYASRDLKVRIIGGTAPYKIDLTLNKVSQSVTIYDDVYEFKGLSGGDYKIKVTESRNQSQEEAFAISESGSVDVEIEPTWALKENGKTTIYTTGKQINKHPLKYEWYFKGEIKSTEKVYEAEMAGDYIVKVYNDNCEKQLPFTVTENDRNLNTYWAIYPNPVKHGEPFTIQFGLARESNVTISVYSIEGKLITNENLGLIKDSNYTSTLTTSGVYSVKVQINDLAETSKIIVE